RCTGISDRPYGRLLAAAAPAGPEGHRDAEECPGYTVKGRLPAHPRGNEEHRACPQEQHAAEPDPPALGQATPSSVSGSSGGSRSSCSNCTSSASMPSRSGITATSSRTSTWARTPGGSALPSWVGM